MHTIPVFRAFTLRNIRSRSYMLRRSLFLSIGLPGLILVLLLSACGSNAGSGATGTTPGSNASPTSSPTMTTTPAPTSTPASTTASPSASSTPPSTSISQGYGTANGCPSDAIVTSEPAANVTLQPTNANTSVTAHPGDIIEVRLPFGHKWSGPRTSAGTLELQQPYGYAWKADKVCIWRFVAKGTGTTHLNFQSQPLCKPGMMCALYIANFPVTISVK